LPNQHKKRLKADEQEIDEIRALEAKAAHRNLTNGGNFSRFRS